MQPWSQLKLDIKSISPTDMTATVVCNWKPSFLHPSGLIHCYIMSHQTTDTSPGSFILDQFHVDSLNAYIEAREYVLVTITKVLKNKIVPASAKRNLERALAKGVKSAVLELRPREIINEAAVIAALPKLRGRHLVSDTPTTQSFFTMSINTVWDDEHPLRFSFRDQKFVDWSRG